MLLYANSDHELNQLLTTYQRALLFFSASWCHPCKQMTPIVQRLELERPDLVIIKIDIEKCLEMTKAARIQSIPTFQVYLGNGKVSPTILVGAQSILALTQLLDRNI